MSAAASGNVNPANSGASVAVEDKPVSRPARSAGWVFSRLLVTLGALLFAYAVWVPWELVTFGTPSTTSAPSAQVAVSFSVATIMRLATVTDQPTAIFLVSLFAVLGILLAPLLWRRSDSLLGAIATHLLGIWLLFATVFTFEAFSLDTLVLKGIRPEAVSNVASVQYQYAIGLWLAIAALALLWVGIVLLLFSEWRMHAFWHGLPSLDGASVRAAIPGTALLTLGLLIWAYGFVSAAWLTFNCNTSVPLLFGTCQGLDANAVISTVLNQSEASQSSLILAVDPEVAHYAISLLLGGGALLVLLGAWQRVRSVTYSTWATLWLLTAVAFGALTYYGVTQLTAPGAQLPKGVSGVTGAIGILATIVGLAFTLIGLIAFWIAAFRQKSEA
jgi:hypothetical protein